jgi:hypothetical protein
MKRTGARTLALLALGAVLVALAHPAAAQVESRGSIGGRLTDTSGAAVPGATVTATNVDTNLSVHGITDGEGNYHLLYLPAGHYRLLAELQGFKKVNRSGIEVRVGDRLNIDVTLEPGDLTEAIEVTATTPLLDTTTGSQGQVIDAKRIQLLPLSDGNPFVLSRLAGGAAYTGDLKFSRPFDNGGTSSITVDGGSGSNEFTLDGSPNLAHGRRVAYVPPSDAVEEFKVETATYDAQQGHTAGATVNVVMKSGKNKLEGSAYEFYRSDKLSANDFFLNRAGKPRAPLSYNRYGGTLGGPLVLPGYDGKDRTFFFAAYEGLQDEFPEPGTYSVPTEAMRRGDFSSLLSQGIVIYNPFTAVKRPDGRIERQPFPGNIIPANLISPIAQNYLNLFPSPNQPGDAQGRNNYIGPNGRSDTFNSASLRIDHKLSDANRLFARYSWNSRREARGNWSGETDGVRATGNYLFRRNHNVTIDDVYTHSAKTLLDVRVGFSRFEEPNVRQHEGVFDPSTLGFSSTTASYFGDASYVPQFEIGVRNLGSPSNATDAISTLGDTLGDQRYTTIYSLQPTLTHIMGSHSLRLGYDFRIHRDNAISPGHEAGRYDFGTDFTRGPLDNSPGAAAGQQLASLLLGLPTSGFIDRNASRANQSLYNGIFVQDDWKVTTRLMLNLGLRYDYETPATERYNRNIKGFDPSAASPIAARAQAAYAAQPLPEVAAAGFRVQGGLAFLSDNDRNMWVADKNNIQPRVGFAYQLDDKTVLRGGWGIYTVPNLLESFNQSGFSQATNIVPTLDAGLTFPATLANPFPNGVATPPGSSLGAGTFLGRDLGAQDSQVFLLNSVRKNEKSMRWSVGFERQLPGHWAFEAAYVGNYGYDLTVQAADGTALRNYVDINAVPAQYLSTSPVRDTATINNLTANVPNPFQGLAPGTSLNGSTVQRLQLLKPYPQFLSVRTELRDGTATYNAAQFRLEKRFTAGYSLLLSYTYSRFRDKTILLNPTDTAKQDYAADADIPHRLAASGIFELPFGKNKAINLGSFGNAVLSGWSFQGIYNWQSGRPITFGNVYYNGDPSQLKADYSNPDHVFDTSGFYFNDAGVQTGGVVDPAKQRADTRIRLANNIRTFPFRPGLRSPNISFLDCSLIRTINMSQSVRMQLRFEAINAFNHPIFANPNTDPTSADFGKVTSQFNIPRNLQLAVKLLF